MILKLNFLIPFFVFICATHTTFAQSQQKPDPEVEAFKNKLNLYFWKYQRADNSPMPVKPLDSTGSDMPTGNLKSLMIDKEAGLAFDFSTKKIFDQQTELVYDMKTNMIYNPETDEFFEYEIQDKGILFYRKLIPGGTIGYFEPEGK